MLQLILPNIISFCPSQNFVEQPPLSENQCNVVVKSGSIESAEADVILNPVGQNFDFTGTRFFITYLLISFFRTYIDFLQKSYCFL